MRFHAMRKCICQSRRGGIPSPATTTSAVSLPSSQTLPWGYNLPVAAAPSSQMRYEQFQRSRRHLKIVLGEVEFQLFHEEVQLFLSTAASLLFCVESMTRTSASSDSFFFSGRISLLQHFIGNFEFFLPVFPRQMVIGADVMWQT